MNYIPIKIINLSLSVPGVIEFATHYGTSVSRHIMVFLSSYMLHFEKKIDFIVCILLYENIAYSIVCQEYMGYPLKLRPN